jgi:hypothetical protein
MRKSLDLEEGGGSNQSVESSLQIPPMIRSSIHPAYWTGGGNRGSHVEVLLLGVEEVKLGEGLDRQR